MKWRLDRIRCFDLQICLVHVSDRDDDRLRPILIDEYAARNCICICFTVEHCALNNAEEAGWAGTLVNCVDKFACILAMKLAAEAKLTDV